MSTEAQQPEAIAARGSRLMAGTRLREKTGLKALPEVEDGQPCLALPDVEVGQT
jgi:hypothetical protein